MKKVVVIGGGITGISTMHYLQQQAKEQGIELSLTLIEKDQQLGGKMTTKVRDGYLMEVGADSIVSRHASVLKLVKELQLEDRVVYNDTGVSYILTQNELHAIPEDSVFGIPMNKEALEKSTLISDEGKKSVLRDLERLEVPFTGNHSVGEFLTYYLGEEIVQKQIAPVLSGVYSGDLNKLTIASTLPYLLEYKNEFGSIMRGFEANKDFYQENAKRKFISFKNGLVELFDRIEETLENAIILKNTAVELLKQDANGYKIQIDTGEWLAADEVVLAIPHQGAQKLLEQTPFQHEFNALQTGSIITVYLAYDLPNDVLPADGTGYIVSTDNDVECNACTWTSRKWRHTSKDGKLLIRMFYKKNNPRFEAFCQMTDEELAQVARQDIEKSLKITDEPTWVDVTKWFDAMPIYNLQHKQAVERIEQQMQLHHPHVHLAGCSYYGVGIGLCIQNGEDVAKRVMQKILQDRRELV